MNKSPAAGIDPNPEDRLKGGGEVTASRVLRNMKEVRLWWSGRHTGNSNHRGSGRRGVYETSQIWLCGCLNVAQIRKPVGLDFQAVKTRLVFNQGEPEKRITLQGRESESTLMTLAQPGCRPPYKVQVLVLQANTLSSCSPHLFGSVSPM